MQDTDALVGGTTGPERATAPGPARLVKLLRPSKLLDSLRVRRFRRGFAKLPVEPGEEIIYLGTGYGGWAIPDGILGADSVCYCVGAGGDISFELGLIDRYGCAVVSFDPAAESEAHANAAAAGRSGYRFLRVGIWDSDGTMPMYVASDPDHMALSGANLQRTADTIEVPIRSLPSVMAELGHERVDLLKLSVEGLEYELVPKIDLRAMGVRIFSLEFSQLVRPLLAAELVNSLGDQGYAPVFRNPREQRRTTLTFLRRDS